MSAWYVMSAAGIYPVTPGQPIYAIGTPLFPELRFNLENGKSFVIRARDVSPRNFYIQSATLNGRPYHRAYLRHQDLMNGGELVFQMGPAPSLNWAASEADWPRSSVAGDQIVPAPIIDAPSETFRTQLRVAIHAADRDARIYFTTDGSRPTRQSSIYHDPVLVSETTTIKAIAIAPSGAESLPAAGTIHRLPHDWTIKYFSSYSSQYNGGGDQALIDGIRGNANFNLAWQGFEGQDFVCVVDLGKMQPVTKVGAGFLQDVGSWIWMPRQVEFELSTDGQNFTRLSVIASQVSDRQYGTVIRDFVRRMPGQPARYVRITARNYGTIPDWHPGSGGRAWIFVDEILIE